MDVQNLQAFKAVADHGSFSRAADSLHLTQPAVSKRIAALENQLGVKLFDRIGKLVSLTEAGELLRPRGEDILDRISEAKKELSNLHGKVGGQLSFACSHHIGLHRMPDVLQTFKGRHPQVQLALVFNESEAAFAEVIKGSLEFAVVTLPKQAPEKLRMLPIWQDDLVFCCAKNSALNKDNFLSDAGAIFPPANTVTRELIEAELKRHKLSYSVAMESPYLETIQRMVEIDLGWSVLPRTQLSDQLREIPIKDITIGRELGVAVHRDRTLSNAAGAMLELLKQQSLKARQTD